MFVVGFCLCCYVLMLFSFLPSFLEASMLHCLKQQRAGYLLHTTVRRDTTCLPCCCRPKPVFQYIIRSGVEASFIHCLKLHLFIASFHSLLGASLVRSFIPSLLGKLFVHFFIAPKLHFFIASLLDRCRLQLRCCCLKRLFTLSFIRSSTHSLLHLYC